MRSLTNTLTHDIELLKWNMSMLNQVRTLTLMLGIGIKILDLGLLYLGHAYKKSVALS